MRRCQSTRSFEIEMARSHMSVRGPNEECGSDTSEDSIADPQKARLKLVSNRSPHVEMLIA